MKTAKQMERHFKGVSNHRRIDILFLVSKRPGITVDKISERLDCNFKTISEHVKKLTHAGLIDKKYYGRGVSHSLTPYGQKFLAFIKTF